MKVNLFNINLDKYKQIEIFKVVLYCKEPYEYPTISFNLLFNSLTLAENFIVDYLNENSNFVEVSKDVDELRSYECYIKEFDYRLVIVKDTLLQLK